MIWVIQLSIVLLGKKNCFCMYLLILESLLKASLQTCSHVIDCCIVFVLECVPFLMGDTSETGHPVRLFLVLYVERAKYPELRTSKRRLLSLMDPPQSLVLSCQTM